MNYLKQLLIRSTLNPGDFGLLSYDNLEEQLNTQESKTTFSNCVQQAYNMWKDNQFKKDKITRLYNYINTLGW